MIKKRHTEKMKKARTNNLLWEACKKEAMGISKKFTPQKMALTQKLYKERSKD
jgi:hypothetical protein